MANKEAEKKEGKKDDAKDKKDAKDTGDAKKEVAVESKK